MNDEAQLKAKLEDPDLCVITGSRLYGNARYNESGECISDTDYRGVVLPPLPYLLDLLGFKGFDEANVVGYEDHKVYSLKKFLDMLLKGNAQALEVIFAPASHVVKASPLGRELLDRRHLFVSKLFYKSTCGYASTEWRKARGVRVIIPGRTKTEDTVVTDMLNVFSHLTKDVKDDIIQLLFSQHEYKEVASKAGVGSKRALEFDKFGYGVSSAAHAIRLHKQTQELLETGGLTFPRPEASLLGKIKRGEMSFEEVEGIYNEESERTKAAYESSLLPERPNHKPIWDFYRGVVYEQVKEGIAVES